ncbi:MAG: hypothetical protein E7380_02940 [Clostridiales bacterium]|nr:hypothetical protein [Clostridiales bacterium]
MKKTKVFLTSMLISIFMLCMLLLTACGGIPGTYYLESMEANGMHIEAGEPYMGVTIDEEYIVVEIENDGSFSMSMSGSMSFKGTWKDLGDGTIELTVDGDPLVCECDGDTLVMDMDGAKVTLKK